MRMVLGGLMLLFSAAGVSSDMSQDIRDITTYPFFSTAERAAMIRAGYVKITPGMSSADVRAMLGTPDEVRPLYAPMAKNPQVIAQTYWYVLRRLVAHGSQSEQQESAVRVSLDLAGVVTAIDALGIE